jgi:NADH dehydrogenase FAD-containing subunit
MERVGNLKVKTIILVGGGNNHLYCLKKLIKTNTTEIKWILISPSQYHYYSGMFSEYIEDLYSLEKIRIDLKNLCKEASVDFVESTVLSFDPYQQNLLTDKGEIYSYDYVSFGIGSKYQMPAIKGLEKYTPSIKPYSQLPTKIEKLHNSRNSLFIGADSTSVELALSLRAWKMKNGLSNDQISIVHSATALLEEKGRNTSRTITEFAIKQGLTLYSGQTVQKIENGYAYTKEAKIPFDEVICLAGPVAPPMFRSNPIKTDNKGFMLVNSSLQSLSFSNIFGVGDCATLVDFSHLPKKGITAARQGPILWKNLMRSVEGKALIPFEPPSRHLSILSVGEKKGMLTYGSFSIVGSWIWRLKKRMDMRFIKKDSGE